MSTTEVSCDDLDLLASELIDGELSVDQAKAVTDHLAECPDCRAQTQQLHAAVRALRQSAKSQAAADAVVPAQDQVSDPQVVSLDALPTTEPPLEPELDPDADTAKLYLSGLYPQASGEAEVDQPDPGFPQPQDAFDVEIDLTDGPDLALSAEQIDAAVNALPEPQRSAVALVDMQQLSRADAAARLGLSTSDLARTVQSGRSLVRNALLG